VEIADIGVLYSTIEALMLGCGCAVTGGSKFMIKRPFYTNYRYAECGNAGLGGRLG
jgi:hypothetical protein